MNLKRIAFLLLPAIMIGCQGSTAEMSADYKKLPPGEGERRLKETLKRRAEGKHLDHPYGANESVPAAGN